MMSTAALQPAVVRIKGKNTSVPSATISDRQVVVTGSMLKVAQVFDEELVEGEAVPDPAAFIRHLKGSSLRADIFTFAQRPPEITPKFNEHFEWDNWAVAPTADPAAWWESLPQEARKNVRRSAKRGVQVRTVQFDDVLVEGIRGIYNETPVRQGKKFWHYGKDFETVKDESGTYPDRSEFVGAFLGEELIGFLKMIYVNRAAMLIHILAKNAHHDKRPMNAILAHAVEVCARKNMSMLVYGAYIYGKKNDSSLTEFKRRNGFEQVNFPRYYVALSAKGRAALACGMHLGAANLIPKTVTDLLLQCRSRVLQTWRGRAASRSVAVEESRG